MEEKVANGELPSYGEVAEVISDVLQTSDIPIPEDELKRRNPNIKLARDLLDWEPKVNLDSGLDITIDYFKRIRGN